jgi:hypothetical protein
MDRLIYTADRRRQAHPGAAGHRGEQPGQRHHHRLPRAARHVPRGAGGVEGLPTRAFVVDSTVGADIAPARCRPPAARSTSRSRPGLDRGADRRRQRSVHPQRRLQISENGLLQNASGQTIQGEGGPITIPPDTNVTIGGDGTVARCRPTTSRGRRTCWAPQAGQSRRSQDLVRGDDGLFRLKDGASAQPTRCARGRRRAGGQQRQCGRFHGQYDQLGGSFETK